jgi:tetratricopeptide (TPR) repeat protein
MIHPMLARKYLCLANGFAHHHDAVDALACAGRAVELDPDCWHEAREPLKGLVLEGAALPAQPHADPDLARLRRRKRQLDSLSAGEREIVRSIERLAPDDSCDDGGDGTSTGASESPLPSELKRRMAAVEKRLHSDEGQRFAAVRDEFTELLRRTCPDGLPDSEDLDGPNDQSWLSLEHALTNLGNDLYRLGRFSDAITVYSVILAVDDLLEVFFNRALAYTRKSEYGPAKRDMSKVIEKNHRLAEAWYTRGLIHEYEEDYDAAISDYERAVLEDPGYHKAREQREIAVRKRTQVRSESRRGPNDSDDHGLVQSFDEYLVRPTTKLGHVGGNYEAKRKLEIVASYLSGNDKAIAEWGAEPPRGVLLCGEPGTGKTYLAEALAGTVDCPFYAIPAGSLESCWAGNTQKNLTNLFAAAAKHPASILFFDEFDSLAQNRTRADHPSGEYWYNRTIGCLLNLMDGLSRRSQRLVVLAATNCPQDIDQAFTKRAGRFSFVVEVPRPDRFALAEIFLIQLELAQQRAQRVDFMSEELEKAVLAPDRRSWLERLFAEDTVDRSGIRRLADLAAEKQFVGDDCREVIRRTIDDRIFAAVDWVDLGPITPQELLDQVATYAKFQPEV